METPSYWRKCSVCKREIKFDKAYQICTVSTCRKSVYCSVECFDTHVPLMNHKSAWAEEHRAPTLNQYVKQQAQSQTIKQQKEDEMDLDTEVLVVASKLRQFIKEKGELNTSGNVMEVVSEILRSMTLEAIDAAKKEGRKTLMDRDFKLYVKKQ